MTDHRGPEAGHVALLLVDAAPYGATRMAATYAQALLADGWAVTVLYGRRAADRFATAQPLLESLVANGAEVEQVTGLGRLGLTGVVGSVRRLRSVDVVISAQLGVMAQGAAIARLVRAGSVPFVQAPPVFVGSAPARFIKSHVLRRVLGSADRVVAVSSQVESSLVGDFGMTSERVTVIDNALSIDGALSINRAPSIDNARQMLGVDDATALVLTVGRVHPQKGHGDLIEAVAELDRPDVAVVIAGGAESAAGQRLQVELETAAAGSGLDVRFVGFRSDIATWLEACDLFVLSSHWEGLSLAVLEAMVAAAPIVVTTPAAPPGFVDGVHGRVVPAGDAALLAGAMADVLEMGEGERASLGLNARSLVGTLGDVVGQSRRFVEVVRSARR